jgi:hypothetical protein
MHPTVFEIIMSLTKCKNEKQKKNGRLPKSMIAMIA